LVALSLWPIGLDGLDASDANPTSSYAEASQRFDAWAEPESDLNVFEPCRSGLYGTGERTAVSVVFFHGLTNCPRQFQELAETLQENGVNVVVLRAPEHGIASDDSASIGDVGYANSFTADDMREWADTSVDIGEGLGEQVRVLGLSMGGVAAAWVAQHREVDRVVAVSPALTLHGVPDFVQYAFPNLFTRIPHFSVEAAPTLDHAYPGTTPAGAAEMYRMAREVLRSADDRPPKTTDLVVITNAADDQIDNNDVDELVARWLAHGADVATSRFPADAALPHDVVDSGQKTGNTALTWPVFLEALQAP